LGFDAGMDYRQNPVEQMKIAAPLTVNHYAEVQRVWLVGAGRLASACDIYEKMLETKTAPHVLRFLVRWVPAGLRVLSAINTQKTIDVVVCTGASWSRRIEAVGGRTTKAVASR
jgi:deoxyhypusine synthase